MVVVGEPNPSFESAAFSLVVPAGCMHDPEGKAGLASLACEMVLRGAGQRDGRALINDLDNLGVDRGESVGVSQTVFHACGVKESLTGALAIYADILRRPLLPADQLEAGRLVCLQELRGVEDEPHMKVVQELRRQHYPSPWGLPSQGQIESVETLTLVDVAEFHRQRYRPDETILAVAGGFDWDALIGVVEELFGDWTGAGDAQPLPPPAIEPVSFVPYDSNQTHLGLAYDSIPYRHEDYFQAWASVGVLSGGTSSRLFTEVRERRGLCYTVSASLQSHRDHAAVLCYAGTTAERAQETLEVTYGELMKLREGIRQEELDRLKARIKSSMILQQESSTSRSGALARDWRHLGRARTLDELSAIIDAITAESINEFLSKQPPDRFTVVTLGPEPLESPIGSDA